MANLEESFDQMADADMWMDLAAIGGGYLGSTVAQSVIEGAAGFDAPNEVYGVGVAYLGYTVDVEYSDRMAMGGGLYTLDSLAQRVGLKERVTEIGGN